MFHRRKKIDRRLCAQHVWTSLRWVFYSFLVILKRLKSGEAPKTVKAAQQCLGPGPFRLLAALPRSSGSYAPKVHARVCSWGLFLMDTGRGLFNCKQHGIIRMDQHWFYIPDCFLDESLDAHPEATAILIWTEGFAGSWHILVYNMNKDVYKYI